MKQGKTILDTRPKTYRGKDTFYGISVVEFENDYVVRLEAVDIDTEETCISSSEPILRIDKKTGKTTCFREIEKDTWR